MLIDKPQCNFKNCRHCFDGNCRSADKYENCKLTDLGYKIAKLTVDLENAKSEVAREIFEEIENRLLNHIADYHGCYHRTFDELKKKYTEGEE